MLIFPVGDCVPSPSHLVEGHPTQLGKCAGHAGIPDARDLHAGPCILWTGRALQEVYQGVCQYSVPIVQCAGEGSEDGSGGAAPKAWEKPFLLETDASKEGLGVVLSQKQSDRRYHPIAFGSCSLTPAEKNYHSSKLEFLTLKWSMMEHFKEYLAYAPFVVQTDNNPLTYVLTMPNLDATGHRWVGLLASFQFKLEYQKGTDNEATDMLS